MSHFTVTVCLTGDVHTDHLEASLGSVLGRYDENKSAPRYVEYTREQLIAKGRKEIEDFRDGAYAKYQADPIAYTANCRNDAHLTYILGTSEDGGFPAKLQWTDEQVYQAEIRWHEPEDIGADGEVYSTYNPDSKWDWWTIGGRWGGMWTFRPGVDTHSPLKTRRSAFGVAPNADLPHRTDCARVRDILPETLTPTFALVDCEGYWHEKGEMGWWAVVADEKAQDEWDAIYRKAIDALPPDTWLINVDCHI